MTATFPTRNYPANITSNNFLSIVSQIATLKIHARKLCLGGLAESLETRLLEISSNRLGKPRFRAPDPSREGGILDAAFICEDRGTEAAGLKSGENLALSSESVAGASGLIGFDDDVGGLLNVGFHRTGIRRPTSRRGIVGFC